MNEKSKICKVSGELKGSVDEIDKLLASGTVDLTIDFSGCRFISVEGLEWLEELLLRATSLQAKVSFVNMQPPVYKVFKVAHVDSILQATGAPPRSSNGAPAC
jgi:anti-anti-sigma regulatory factor